MFYVRSSSLTEKLHNNQIISNLRTPKKIQVLFPEAQKKALHIGRAFFPINGLITSFHPYLVGQPASQAFLPESQQPWLLS